ncbi:hypothetical protein D3C85_1235650 [compost metagenome]
MSLFVAPAVEIEIHRAEIALAIDDEIGTDVAHPDVVEFGDDVGDVLRTAMFFGQIPFAVATEHGDRLITGDGPRDQAQCRLHVSGEVFPDGVLRAKRDECLLMLVAFIRHVPTTLARRQHLRGAQAKAHESGCHTGGNRYLFDEFATR